MENTYNPTIQEWMIRIIVVLGKDHNIAVGCVCINGVLLSADIICGIIDTKNVVQIYAVVLE